MTRRKWTSAFISLLALFIRITDSLTVNIQELSLAPKLLILLDRDGVINVDVGPPGVLLPTQLQLTPHAATAIGSLKRRGHIVAVITNQSCVGKGLISLENLDQIHSHLQRMLLEQDKDAQLDSIYFCTTPPTCSDSRRKPQPGMIQEAFEFVNSKLERDEVMTFQHHCVLIGDSWRDLEAAAACDIPCRILVSTGYGLECMDGKRPSGYMEKITTYPEHNTAVEKVLPFFYTENLASATSWITSNTH